MVQELKQENQIAYQYQYSVSEEHFKGDWSKRDFKKAAINCKKVR